MLALVDMDAQRILNLGFWHKLERWLRPSISRVNSDIVIPGSARLEKLNSQVYEVCRPIGSGKPSVEVIFFHGLQLEHSSQRHVTTWLSANKSELWLNWLPVDNPDIRVLVVSYDASIKRTDKEGITDMFITSENLVHDLTDSAANVGQDGCPVILVGHCLGGLIMKEVCVKANSILALENPNQLHNCRVKKVQNFLSNVKGLFFYATPHHGVIIRPNLDTDTGNESQWGELVRELAPLNKEAQRRNEEFRMLRQKWKWKAAGVGEGREVFTQDNLTGFVLCVPEASSRSDIDGMGYYTVGTADHFTITSPTDRKSPSFTLLRDFMEQLLKEYQSSLRDGLKRKRDKWVAQLHEDPIQEVVDAGLFRRNLDHIPVPLPFASDRKYVPIALSIVEVEIALENPDGPSVVTLYGAPGTGKTSLLKHVALQYEKERTQQADSLALTTFPDGVFYLQCGKGADRKMDQLKGELIESLGAGSERELRLKLVQKKALIIVDDVWERKVLEGILMPGKAVKYLVSSQHCEIWPDARKIHMEMPTLEEASQILATYAEGADRKVLPDNFESIALDFTRDLESHPMALAQVGLVMNLTETNNPDEWRILRKDWVDLLEQKDLPPMYQKSYSFALSKAMNHMVASLTERERSLLLLICLLREDRIAERVIKSFRKRMKAEEKSWQYLKCKDVLIKKCLIEVRLTYDREPTREYFVVHGVRAHCIRKRYAKQMESMVRHLFEPAAMSSTDDHDLHGSRAIVTSSGHVGEGHPYDRAQGFLTTSRGAVRISERVFDTAIMGVLYIPKRFWPSATVITNVGKLLIGNGDVPREICADVDVTEMLERAQDQEYKIRPLVVLLDLDGEEEWKQQARRHARKVIVKFMCRQELDDESAACLILLPETTSAMCNMLRDLLSDSQYWIPGYLYQHQTFSSAHSETIKSLLRVLEDSKATPDIRDSVIDVLGDEEIFCGVGILDYGSHDTILNIARILMNLLAPDAERMLPVAFNDWDVNRLSVSYFKADISRLWGEVYNLLKEKPASLPRESPKVYDGGGYAQVIETFLTLFDGVRVLFNLVRWSGFASIIKNASGFLDMLCDLAASGPRCAHGTWSEAYSSDYNLVRDLALVTLEELSLMPKHRKQIWDNKIFQESVERMLTTATEHCTCHACAVSVEFFALVLGNLALTDILRDCIVSSSPNLGERLHCLQVQFRHFGTSGAAWNLHPVASISEVRTILDPDHRDPEAQRYSFSNDDFKALWEEWIRVGRICGFLKLQMYQKAVAVVSDIQPHDSFYARINSDQLRSIAAYAKALSKDYAGAIIHLNVAERRGSDRNWAIGERGVIRKLSGEIAKALVDFNECVDILHSSVIDADDLVLLYCVLRHRGAVKHLMEDEAGARKDAVDAKHLESRVLVLQSCNSFDNSWIAIFLLALPVAYLGFTFPSLETELSILE